MGNPNIITANVRVHTRAEETEDMQRSGSSAHRAFMTHGVAGAGNEERYESGSDVREWVSGSSAIARTTQ